MEINKDKSEMIVIEDADKINHILYLTPKQIKGLNYIKKHVEKNGGNVSYINLISDSIDLLLNTLEFEAIQKYTIYPAKD